MSIAPNLFDPLYPPGVWVTLHELEHCESDERKVTIRIKASGRKSISATAVVSKYSPEVSIMRALMHVLEEAELCQAVVTTYWLKACLGRNITAYVEPF